MSNPRLIGPLARAASTEPRSTGGAPRRIPDDLLRQASRRAQIMSLIAAFLWLTAPALGHLALYQLNPGDPRWAQFRVPDLIAAVSIVISLGMYGYLRRSERDPDLTTPTR